MTTPEDLERLADPADKSQLYPYDDGRFLYLVKPHAHAWRSRSRISNRGRSKVEVVGFKRRHRDLQIHS